MKRYRMMPLRGWQILIAKDAAFLTIAVVLALPLSIPGAIRLGAFIALAVGHRTSIESPRRRLRWRVPRQVRHSAMRLARSYRW